MFNERTRICTSMYVSFWHKVKVNVIIIIARLEMDIHFFFVAVAQLVVGW